MDEYISREETVKKITFLCELREIVCDPDDEFLRGLKNALNAVKSNELIPTADVQPVSQWISVEDKLPIEQGPVLCYARSTTGEGNYRILGTLRNGEFWFLQVDGTQLSFPCLHLKVTHWMPLPEPPKDGDTNA